MDSDWRCISYWRWGYSIASRVSLPEGILKHHPGAFLHPAKKIVVSIGWYQIITMENGRFTKHHPIPRDWGAGLANLTPDSWNLWITVQTGGGNGAGGYFFGTAPVFFFPFFWDLVIFKAKWGDVSIIICFLFFFGVGEMEMMLVLMFCGYFFFWDFGVVCYI